MKKLERKLSLSSVIAISIAGMLGSGIFVLPGIAAAKTGSSIWLAYLIAAICILPAALSKSELATAMPKSGGSYVYIERALGPLFGTISGIGLWLSLLLKSSFALVGFGAYLLVLTNIPSSEVDTYMQYFSIGFLILIMFLNIFGVKKVGKIQLVIVILSLLTLLSILFLGLPKVDMQLTQFMINGAMGLVETVAFVYISYAGVTKIAAIAGEVKNPSRNIPLAMLLSLLVISSLYVSIAYTLVGNVQLDILEKDIKPIHTLATLLAGEWFAYGVAIIGVITLISMANSGVLASSRFPFAMAMDKLLPSNLAKLHDKHLTPINAILLTCLMMALIILFLDVPSIVKLASAFMVSMFITVNVCVIVLRETAVQWYKPTYKSPLYPYVQIFGILSGLVLLFNLGWMPILVLLIIALIGVLIYYFYGIKASRTGVLRNYGHRAAKFLFFRKTNDDGETSIDNLSDEKHKDWLDGQINPNAGVIIPLFGNEYSPESLIELGAAINQRESLQVVNIKEVPDQTFLDAVLVETPKIKSLKRQLSIVQDINKLQLDFESIVTHNVSDTMQVLSDHLKSDWLLLSWDGRVSNGFLINNPLGWIVSNINSNFALFKDNGVRYIREVVLAVRPNSKDIDKLIRTTANLCKFYNASFTLLHVLSKDSSKSNLEKIKNNSHLLLTEYNNKANLRIEYSDNPTLTVSELTAEYDLLVLGTPKKDTWKSMLFGTGKDKFAVNSACSVLRLTIND
ncbi:MAG: putative amino acid permease YhdG [Cryomorphaceae bacterium]|nr:MAG: putative amino acid permease YhdG [Cryomorphaceae bacterium]